VRAVFWSLSAQLAKVVFLFLSLILLSRLISPESYGEFIVISAVLVLVIPFLDFALTPIYIRKAVVSERVSNAFYTVNMALSVVSVVVVCLYLLMFYRGNVDVSWVVFLSMGVVFCGACQQKIAGLMREDEYWKLFVVVVVSQCLSLSVAVALAYNSFPLLALCAKFFLEHFVFWCVCKLVFNLNNQLVGLSEVKHYKNDICSAVQILLARISESLGLFSERLLLVATYSNGALGNYYRANDLGKVADFVVRGGLTGVVINKYRKSTLRGFLKTLLVFLFFVSVASLVLLILFFFGRSLISLLLGDDWKVVSDMFLGVAVFSFSKIIQNSCYIVCVCNEYYRLWSFLGMVFYAAYILFIYCLLTFFSLGIVDFICVLTMATSVFWLCAIFLISIKVWVCEKSNIYA
jgi:O-antigen/teichoic acid export membrane protein